MIYTIHNDDCFNIFPSIEDKSINMVLVDLPYGQTDCKWDVKIDLTKMWIELKRIGKDNCQYIFFTTTKFGNELIHSNPKMFRYDLVWEKHISVGFLLANKQPLRQHEMIYIFGNTKNSIYNPQKTIGKPYKRKDKNRKDGGVYGTLKNIDTINSTGERHPTSIIKGYNSDKKIHPTQKPLSVCEWLIKTYSNENDLILDFCMGSGSTIVACINTNRKYIGIEKDKEIFKTAQERIIECLGKDETPQGE